MAYAPKTIRQLKGDATKRGRDNRRSACKRGYGRDWQRTRRNYLRQNPLCVDCKLEKRSILAEEVHHIQKVKDRPDLMHDPDNLMGLCKRHHSIRTSRGE